MPKADSVENFAVAYWVTSRRDFFMRFYAHF